jgi:hypothetical protein
MGGIALVAGGRATALPYYGWNCSSSSNIFKLFGGRVTVGPRRCLIMHAIALVDRIALIYSKYFPNIWW